jgi:restriction system protein
MGGMNFGPGALADGLSETAGYKAGLTLSIEELCDHLTGTNYPDIIRDSEEFGTRLRSEDFEALFYKLLHRIGYTKDEYDGDYTGAKRIHKYRREGFEREYEGMLKIFNEVSMEQIRQRSSTEPKPIDLTSFVVKCYKDFGEVGYQMALEQVEVITRGISLSPHSQFRAVNWTAPLALRKLFTGTADAPQLGKFIDQRFINYLSNNIDRLPEMHWRKFEELTAEFFHREGYKVELGPGSNDDGVDVRVWRRGANPTDNPLCLVQCKRQKAKVERVIVKGLYADVKHEEAEYGVIVTTSELSPGSRTTIAARGYPVKEVERVGVSKWLTALRSPGTGIIRL